VSPERLFNELKVDLANRIVNLNNFFIKNDITNANSVLNTTHYEGKEELVDGSERHDRDKKSIFETG
jgi:hypothetical protein